jgi:hypothetical protein
MLEELVRPFQRVYFLRSEPIYVTEVSAPTSGGTKTWGQAGTVPAAVAVAAGTDPNNFGFQLEDCADRYAETSRTTDKVRVVNPTDSSQYVDVNRIKGIHFYKMPKSSWQFQTPSTHWAETDYFAGSPFGDVKQADACGSQYNLHPPAA